MSKNSAMGLLIATGLVVVMVLAACGSSPTQVPPAATQPATQPALSPSEAPALDGAMLLETRCSVCHTTDRAKQAGLTKEQWDQTVALMITKGAKLTDAEKAVLVEYLAKTYGP